MLQSKTYYRELLIRFINDEVTSEEVRELYFFIADNTEVYNEMKEDEEILSSLNNRGKDLDFDEFKTEVERVRTNLLAVLNPPKASGKIKRFKWYWAAASIIIILGLGVFFYINHNSEQAKMTAELPKDVQAPTSNRAMITLADGSRVYLDSVGNGQLAQLGNVKLIKLANGQVAYQTVDGQIMQELQYNTLSNPRGSQVIDISLSDGTKVWLNAGSSITYPVAFVGDERKVELTGEGYFEVAKDQSKRFIVTANGTTTEVLGTHFNVNAYNDEVGIKVTLLEGSIKTGIGEESAIIKPGQQAAITSKVQVERVDVDQIMAWKNGKFDFGEGASLKDVMRQVARWYDVEVEYKDNSNEMFGGTVTRQANLSALLERLELTGKVKFRIEGRKIVVNP